MKKIFAALLLAASATQMADAVPAYPGLIKVKQADGTEISIRIKGDEWNHITTTADGYPIIFNNVSKNYEYAVVSNGKLVSSNVAAADVTMRDAAAKRLLEGIDKEQAAKMAVENGSATPMGGLRKAGQPKRALMNNFPHFGEQHTMVVLVEFNDRSFSTVSDAKQYYTDALNKENFTASNGATGSARDYFIASSKGKFQPYFDVYGPVKIDYSQYYFGQGTQTATPNAGTMVQEAIKQLDGKVDFKQYDHDGDGYVDNIYIYYAGYGSNDSGYNNVIWPHAFSLTDWGIYMRTSDGMRIGSYTCSNEINGRRRNYPAGVGTFIHEFGHCLGLMDHYDTDNSYAEYTPGDWDIMASGSYLNDSNTPPLYSAYECDELGWADLIQLDNTADTVNVLTPFTTGDKAYKVKVEGKSNEYFILENRKKTGWDAYLPSEGMLAWHIDYDYNTWKQNVVNVNSAHQHIDIVEAGNILSGSYYGQDYVPFPGSGNVASYNFKDWSGNSAIYLDKIKKDGDNVSFIIKGADSGLAKVAGLKLEDTSYNGAECSWEPADKATEYIVNLKTVNANAGSGQEELVPVSKYYNVKTTDTSISLTDLTPETTYEISVASSVGTFQTEPVTARFTTEMLPFEMRQVEGVTASDVTDNSFTAKWEKLVDAQSYKATVNKISYDGETTSTAYDFSEMLSGMPDGWSISTTNWVTSNGFYGNASPALRFTLNNAYIVLTNKSAAISNVKFWMRAQQTGAGSSLDIQEQDGDKWVTLESISLSSGNGQTYDINIKPSRVVRLRFNRKSSGNLYIDDIEINGNAMTTTPVAIYNGKDLGDVTEFTFNQLDAETEYGLTVTGTYNGVLSLPSEMLTVNTIKTTDGIKEVSNGLTGNEGRSFFTVSGTKLNGKPTGKGVFIMRENGKTVKTTK